MAYRNGNFYGLRVASVQKAEEDEERNMQGTTAILTGASGGLAFPYALWMAAAGAEKIALVSRNQSKNLGILLEVMDYYGLQGRLIKADVTDMEQMKRCWKQLEEDGWLQEGKQVFCHLAGYSQDCSYGKITPRILKKHLEPKMEGAKNLAELVKQSGGQLILIGSITAMLGNPGAGDVMGRQIVCFRLLRNMEDIGWKGSGHWIPEWRSERKGSAMPCKGRGLGLWKAAKRSGAGKNVEQI